MQILNGQKNKKASENKSKILSLFDRKDRVDWTTIFIIGTSVSQFIFFLFLFILAINVYQLANKPAPTLVQLTDGTSIKVKAINSLDRSPEAIIKFVSETCSLLFNWSNILSNDSKTNNLQFDSGVSIDGNLFSSSRGKKVPTSVWEASFALSEKFRSDFLKKLAPLIPEGVFQGNSRVVFIIDYLSEPEEIEKGSWKIKMIANMIFFEDNDKIGKAISYNKIIYVRAVPLPTLPSENAASDLQKTVYNIRLSGLEIFKFEEIQN